MHKQSVADLARDFEVHYEPTLGMDPVSLALAASFTLTYTITLPPHSKVNTIYFATGYFTVLEQLKYGIVTCLIGATVISISVFTWFRVLGYGI